MLKFLIAKFYLLRFFLFFFDYKTLIFFPLYYVSFDISLVNDYISTLFLRILLFISASVLVFSKYYMKNKPFFKRFILLMVCFIIRMCWVIICPMSIFMLLGWDGLGIFSFLLVCFYKAERRWSSSLKTYLTKRVGDGIFIFFFCLLVLKNFCFKKILFSSFIGFYLILACFTKRAQIPFRSWLPAAMAAPTPVSSLVHSSTLVTAGIYLLIRSEIEVFGYEIALLGLITALVASFSAMKEYDSKKIVALSTLSKLGIMVFSLGNGFFFQRIFHLFSHAVSKANLFISVGWIMLKKNHHQDIRVLKKKIHKNFFMKLNLSYSIWSLSGLLFFSGFFSKELILERFSKNFSIVQFLFFLVILFSLIYGFRLINVLRFNFRKFFNFHLKKTQKNISIILLVLFSIFLGVFLKKNFFLKRFSVRLKKIVIYSFIVISFFLSLKVKFYKNLAKELFFVQYIGRSFFLKFRKNRNKAFSLIQKNTLRLLENLKKFSKFFKKNNIFKSSLVLKFRIWVLIFCFFVVF